MAIPKGHKSNLKTIIRAANDANLCLMECTDKMTGAVVITLCAVGYENDKYIFYPLAKMFNGNPYDELNPPTE
jgi:hypothetical protein